MSAARRSDTLILNVGGVPKLSQESRFSTVTYATLEEAKLQPVLLASDHLAVKVMVITENDGMVLHIVVAQKVKKTSNEDRLHIIHITAEDVFRQLSHLEPVRNSNYVRKDKRGYRRHRRLGPSSKRGTP